MRIQERSIRKILCASLLTAGLFASTSCESYLDVNTNPNGPDQVVAPQYYLPSIQTGLALGIEFDSRYLGKYVQNWNARDAGDLWDQHGFLASSDASGELWKSVYYIMGANLTDMISKAEEEQKWDFVGVGYLLRAFGWQMLTDYHGEAIVSQAFEPGRTSFDYDTQEEIYAEVRRLTELAITNLERTDGAVATSTLNRGDLIYGGDRAKWLKFAYGLLAINEHHLSNKGSYSPDKVIAYVDKALASNADDASVRFEGSISDDTNFYGPRRGNLNTFRQSKFIVGLLDGTNASLHDNALSVVDPRLPVMLAPAPDGKYRGVTPGVGFTEYEAALRPRNLWNTPTDVVAATTPNKYLFGNNERFPLMTYAQLQFIKAEAAFIKGDKSLALDAYTKGVNAHMDFVKKYVINDPATPEDEVAVFGQRRQAYMASADLIPTDAANLTLSKIMLQKYIAQWGWGFLETWTDLRRYHYSSDVFTGFQLPDPLYGLNQGKPAYRFRPRYNSEYMWNAAALEKIGGLNPDFHTYELWFSKK
ncbi:SusD/RagB family nutrient-binding outer membrane lipoprotein [Pontibacter liquoris]|uniref:SusD/RagB family nutrient-binding outer membrane lipoprotein n=1 Tax=Pontibacter liquoris TaxID=2905677 RepID=UPI001FA7AA73|nr:SusD/RagB family nutrient-binding outer membrane lipoprotein [Pontibacter liquoris]